MRRALLKIATLAVAAGSFGISAVPASAHPVDELVQQIYITPTTTGIDLGIELEPGILVGPDFVAMLDGDGDGQISAAEAAANTAVVQHAIDVIVNGTPATLTLSKSIYPDADVLSAAGGSIALLFTVNADFTDGSTEISVNNGYTPLTSTGQPFTTTIQTNLAPAIDIPVAVATMEHGDLGRSLDATYTLSASQSQLASEGAATSTSTTSTDRTVAVLAVLSTVAALSARLIIWRRRRVTDSVSAGTTAGAQP